MIKKAILIVNNFDAFTELFLEEPPERRSLAYTAEYYREHWITLEEATILKKVNTESIKYFSKYFSVPKNNLVDRSIFNGKRLSQLFQNPDPVNTLDAPRLLDKIQEWNRRSEGKIFAISGDLRHWFHQIRLNVSIQPFFGLHLKNDPVNTSYQWTCLPMGWTWSPFIAQSLAYSFLTYYEEGEESFFDLTGLTDPCLPKFLPLIDREGKERGFLTVYYDNYIVISEDEQLAHRFQERIHLNSSHQRCNVKIKAGSESFCTPTTLAGNNPDEWLTHLGVTIRLDPTTGDLRWRIDRKKIEALPASVNHGTMRDTAQIIGKCLNRHFVSRIPIASLPNAIDLIKLLSRIGKIVHLYREGSYWDTKWSIVAEPLTDSELDLLNNEYASLRDPDHWFSQRRNLQRGELFYLTTDASKAGYGNVLLDEDRNVISDFHKGSLGNSFRFNENMKQMHIYYLELFGAVESALQAIEFLVQYKKPFRLWVIGDNTATVGSLRNGYSSTTQGNRYLARLQSRAQEILHLIGCEPEEVFSFHSIPTDANVADIPSRVFCATPEFAPPGGRNQQRRWKIERNTSLVDQFSKRLDKTRLRIDNLHEGRTVHRGNIMGSTHEIPVDDLDSITQFLHDDDLFYQ